MKVSKLITIFMCGLALISCIGCNKTNGKIIVSGEDKNLTKTKSEIQSDKLGDENKIIPNLIYYVLEEEYLENNDEKNPKVSILVRVYICYDGVKNNKYPDTRSIALDKVNTIEEFRKKLLLDNPDSLKLPARTIVSNKVLNKWKDQNYDEASSYTEESPKGLTYSNIQ